jgi:hypothetical protein
MELLLGTRLDSRQLIVIISNPYKDLESNYFIDDKNKHKDTNSLHKCTQPINSECELESTMQALPNITCFLV